MPGEVKPGDGGNMVTMGTGRWTRTLAEIASFEQQRQTMAVSGMGIITRAPVSASTSVTWLAYGPPLAGTSGRGCIELPAKRRLPGSHSSSPRLWGVRPALQAMTRLRSRRDWLHCRSSRRNATLSGTCYLHAYTECLDETGGWCPVARCPSNPWMDRSTGRMRVDGYRPTLRPL